VTADELRELRAAWIDHAGWYRNPRGKRACWLWQFDDRHYDCAGRLEGIHLLGRQRVRNRLYGVDPEIVELAEWDCRNSALGCTLHHRRFDNHATPGLLVPVYGLPKRTLEFITDYGLETDAEDKFTGSLELALGRPKSSSSVATVLDVAREQPGQIFAGQPSAVSLRAS
jgi:hypothetical protein